MGKCAQYWVVALIAFACYARTAAFPFIWDDLGMVVENRALRSFTDVPRYFTDRSTFSGGKYPDVMFYRPVRNISFLVDYKLFHLDPAWYHLENALLHAVAAALVLALLRRLWLMPGPSGSHHVPFLAALIWAAHPAHTEVVAWVKERDDLLCAVFTIAALLLAVRAVKDGKWWLAFGFTAILSHAAGLLSKETALVTPLLLGLLGFTLREGPCKIKRPIFLAAAMFVMDFGFIVARHAVLGRNSQTDYLAGSFPAMMATMAPALVRYLRVTVWPAWPTRLLADYNAYRMATGFGESRVVASIVLLIAIIVCLGWLIARERKRASGTDLPSPPSLILCGSLWFGICLLPVSNVVPTMQVMAERFLYLPLIGYAILLMGVCRVTSFGRFRDVYFPICAYVIVLLFTQQLRLADWSSPLKLYEATYRTNSRSWRVSANYAEALLAKGDAIAALEIAERLIREQPPRAIFFSIRGAAELKLGRDDMATSDLLCAADMDPKDARPRIELGMDAFQRQDFGRAAQYFRDGTAREPDNAECWYNLATAEYRLGQWSEAEAAAAKAAQLEPDMADAVKLRDAARARGG